MALFNPYLVRREIDNAAPFLLCVLLAMAVDEAIDQESLKPVTKLTTDLLEGIFG